jgi:hypothetical protein
MNTNFGYTFGRTEENRNKEFAELVKRLEKKPATVNTSRTVQKDKPADVTNKDGFVYVPPINLYFAEERSNYNLTWDATHKKVIPEGYEMPSPMETWKFIDYLKNNLSVPKLKKVYDDILKTTPQNTWHGEWQNAIYSNEDGKVWVRHVRGLKKNGEIDLSDRVELNGYLNSDGWADVTSMNNISDEGLCKIASSKDKYSQGENIYFYHPRNGNVARFVANSVRAYLGCHWDPTYSNASLGVRLVIRPKGVTQKS